MNCFIDVISIVWILIFFQNVIHIEANDQNPKSETKEDPTMKLPPSSLFRIGIIGGGIGGTSTAYFARKLMKDKISIDLYEPRLIGGRLATTKKFDDEYETGGSVIEASNLYMKSFVKELGLKPRFECLSKFGLFDGKKFTFVESEWNIVTQLLLLYRYGLDLYYLLKQTEEILKDFTKIYNLQEQMESYESVSSLLTAMNPTFPSMLKEPFRDYLKQKGFKDLFINEIITAITLTNYGQLPNIHSFVGSVAVAGAGSDLWSVLGGNRKVPEGLLDASKANLLQRVATSVDYLDGKFQVTSTIGEVVDTNSDSTTELYDAVAIATPLTKDTTLLKVLNDSIRVDGTYERIVSSVVRGTLNRNTFFEHSGAEDVDEILAFNPQLIYNSIGKQRPVDTENASNCTKGNPGVFKVFSPLPLTKAQLENLFSSWSLIEEKDWLAYPHYSTDLKFDKFQLVPGLYYNNAIENAASAMEMSAIAAKNVALLMYKHLIKEDSHLRPKDPKTEL